MSGHLGIVLPKEASLSRVDGAQVEDESDQVDRRQIHLASPNLPRSQTK